MASRIVFFGPQGSGKGTQAEFASHALRVPVIATGPIFRKSIAEKSELGVLAASYIQHGRLVPDSLTIEMIRKRLQEQDVNNGFVLDGFPRTSAQFNALWEITTMDAVVVLELSDEEAVSRMGGRRLCANNHQYHLTYKPPTQEGICDVDHLPLTIREDDVETSIRERLEIYHRETEPLIEQFRVRGTRVIVIDAKPPIVEVRKSVATALGISL
ncbi:MAG: nucleoside monophosphate kinase [Candidatus Kerfeldbacteria bacterium]|nr:nucleoside monophosphate kinase [Candidatus Kerfeldbacteria bacterium]